MLILIVLIMMILITVMIIMILPMMMMNIEKLEALEDYLKGLMETITNQYGLMIVLVGEQIITWHI